MNQRVDVCVRGGGVVGMALALQLAAQRLRVRLVAHTEPRAHDVRAYALNAASRELLSGLRVWPADAAVQPVTHMQVWGDDGGELRFEHPGPAGDPLAWIVDVPALEARLAQAVSFQSLIEVQPPQDGDDALAAPLTVVCEGRGSFTRDRLGVRFEMQRYGQQAIAARLACERPHDGVARQWFADGDVLALLPLPGQAVALVWSVSDTTHAELMALDAAAFGTRLTEASHHTLGALTLTHDRAAWPLAVGQAHRWVGPGWALAGDAAHTLHPLAGQGLNVGLADVAELARVLAARQGADYWREPGDLRLLRRYERARKAEVVAMMGLTDGLQRLFAQPARGWQVARNTGMRWFGQSGPLKQWAVRRAMGL